MAKTPRAAGRPTPTKAPETVVRDAFGNPAPTMPPPPPPPPAAAKRGPGRPKGSGKPAAAPATAGGRGVRRPPMRQAVGEKVARSRTGEVLTRQRVDRKSTRLNSSHLGISYAVFCLKKKKKKKNTTM